jgi:hypothetical protein
MPNLKEMFAKAKEQEAAKKNKTGSSASKKLTRNVRPDSLLHANLNHKSEHVAKALEQTENLRTPIEAAIKKTDQNSYSVQSFLEDKPETVSKEISNGDQPEPNLSQSAAKLEPKLGQSGQLLEPNWSQQLEPTEMKNQKVEPQPEPKLEPKLRQSAAKVETNQSFASLVGLQRNALIFIYESCRLKGDLLSVPITIQNIADFLGTTTAAVRKAIQRLENKGYIARAAYKDGRGGWSQYRLTNFIYNELLHEETRAKVEPKLGQTRAKVEPQPEPQPEPSTSSSSSYLNNKRTTTRSASDDFETWLAEIDFSVFSPSITQSLVRRCFELHQNLNPLEFEKLLSRFSVHLSSKNNGVKNARGLLISFAGQLAKGQVPLEEIEEPEDVLARKWIDEMKQAKVARENLEKEACDLAFDEWFESLSQESKDQIAQPNSVMTSGHPTQRIFLKSHFAENIWPQQKRAMTNGQLPFTE